MQDPSRPLGHRGLSIFPRGRSVHDGPEVLDVPGLDAMRINDMHLVILVLVRCIQSLDYRAINFSDGEMICVDSLRYHLKSLHTAQYWLQGTVLTCQIL